MTSGRKLIHILLLVAGAVAILCAIGMSGYKTLTGALSSSPKKSFTNSFGKEDGELAVVEIRGVIEDSKDVLKSLEQIEENDDIKALVLRIDSPGGAVAPSQEIFQAVKKLREKKKIVCSFGDLAASGGYYISLGCEKIFANPGTLTGSIGVIMQFTNLAEFFRWAKVDPIVLKAGKFKDVGSPNRAMTTEEKQLMQEMLDSVHRQFKGAVAESRSLKPTFVDMYADGRVFTGEQAKELGFVDELGGETDAIKFAAEMAGIKGKPKILRENLRKDRITRFLESDSQSPLKPVEGMLERALSNLAPQARLRPGVAYYLPSVFYGGSSR